MYCSQPWHMLLWTRVRHTWYLPGKSKGWPRWRSVKQASKQAISQLINQPTNQSIKQSINQSVVWVCRWSGKSTGGKPVIGREWRSLAPKSPAAVLMEQLGARHGGKPLPLTPSLGSPLLRGPPTSGPMMPRSVTICQSINQSMFLVFGGVNRQYLGSPLWRGPPTSGPTMPRVVSNRNCLAYGRMIVCKCLAYGCMTVCICLGYGSMILYLTGKLDWKPHNLCIERWSCRRRCRSCCNFLTQAITATAFAPLGLYVNSISSFQNTTDIHAWRVGHTLGQWKALHCDIHCYILHDMLTTWKLGAALWRLFCSLHYMLVMQDVIV